jgi:YesN/AraC family two-component response regulator
METSMPTISMLVVEDEAITLEHLVMTLERKYPHFKIHKALDGKEGLALFKDHPPEIVLTDINLPEISGLQMAREMQAIKSDTKIVVLSGFKDQIVPEGLRIDHYIDKPVFFEELFDAIEKCLDEIQRIL